MGRERKVDPSLKQNVEIKNVGANLDRLIEWKTEDPIKAIDVAKELKAVAINPHFETLTKGNTAKIHEEGLKVYTWTVNEPEDIQKMTEFGVDGIITNYPERVK